MSVHAMRWAWSQQVGNSTRKLVLVALADHANSDGECWPTMARVAEFAECNARTVQRHIDQLEHEGLVSRERRRVRRDGQFGSWHLRLAMAPPGDTMVSSGQNDQRTPVSHGPADTDDQRTDCPADSGDGVQRTLVSPLEPPGEPSSPDGDGSEAPDAAHGTQRSKGQEPGERSESELLDKTASWLANQHGVAFESRESLHAVYDDVLRAAVQRVPSQRTHHTAMGLVCEYAERVNGEKLPEGHRSRIGRMLKAHLPERVLYAVAESMDWSGLKPEHVDKPEAWMNYATTVVKNLEAAKESA